MAKEIVVTFPNGEKVGETTKKLKTEITILRKETDLLTIGTKEWIASSEKLNALEKKYAAVKEQQKGLTEASNGFKSALGGILNQIPGFSQLSGALSAARGGVGGLTSGFGLLRGAIIATGLGALVLAIIGLVSWFSKTEAGANMISGAMKGIGAVIDTLMGRLWNLGDTLRQLFSDPIKFFKDLGNDVKNAAVEGYEFVQMMDELEDRQRDMEVRAKEADILVDQLLLQAKNVGKTYEERIALLDKANEITRKTYQDQLALSKEYLDAVEKEVAAELKRQGQAEMTDDQADKIKNAKLAYLDLLGQEIQTEEKIANRREQILGKQEKAQQKQTKDKQTAAEVEAAQAAEIAALERAKELEQEADFLQTLKTMNDKFDADQKKADDDLTSEKIANREREIEYEEYVKNVRMQAVNATLDTFANAFGTIASFQEQGSADWKAFATAQAALTAIQGGINAYTSTAAIPVVGPILAPIAAATAVAAGVLSVSRIQATQMPKAKNSSARGEFYTGGFTGYGGKYDPAGVVHKGEVVWSQEDVARFGGVRAVEAMRPTSPLRGYYTGGPVNPFSNNTGRAPMPSGNAGSGSAPIFDMNGLIDAIDKRIVRTVGTLKVQNVVTETQDAMKVVNTIREEANV